MTKEQMIQVAAILTTLAEVEGCPESSLYLLVGCNWESFEKLSFILRGAGFIEIKAHYCTITSKGREIADKLNATLTAAKGV